MLFVFMVVQMEVKEILEGKVVDKWQVYCDFCEGKIIVGIGD